MSIELKRMTPSRAAYFMERFKREEKLLGPNEQAALTYVIDMLEKATTIQQAEAQQPAKGDPVWCVATGERVNGEETYTHHDAYVPLADCFPLYTHQAPSVPDDMVRDAERWRTSLATRPSNTHEVVNAAIDAAMLAAK